MDGITFVKIFFQISDRFLTKFEFHTLVLEVQREAQEKESRQVTKKRGREESKIRIGQKEIQD
jgi:hypothetical protein